MEDKLAKKIKSGKYALSPKSYNYLQLKWRNGGIIKIPKTNARQTSRKYDSDAPPRKTKEHGHQPSKFVNVKWDMSEHL